MKKVIFDCDPGLDDAVALLAAFGARDLQVLAISTVAGNVQGAQTALNARIIRDVIGSGVKVPVCAGASRPLLRDPVTAEDYHGTTGLGNLDLPRPSSPLSRAHAVNTITRLCRSARSEPITVILTGPMTNLALALTMDPSIRDGIERVVLMGGAHTEGGNITPFAEFNVFADPHAAAIVFGSGLPIHCLNLDATHQLRTDPARLSKVRAVGGRQADVAADLLDASCKLEFSANGDRDAPLHDPSTVIFVTHPEAFHGRRATVTVNVAPGERFGQTVPEFNERGNVVWYDQVDGDAVFEALCQHLGGYA